MTTPLAPASTPGNASAADRAAIDGHLDALWLEKGLSQNTLEAYGRDLSAFAAWLATRNCSLADAQREDLLDYLALRFDAGAKAGSTARTLSSLRSYFGRRARETGNPDPTLQIESPRLGRPLPHSLTESDVDALLDAPDTQTTLGLRDRAMLEVLYACGLRVSELTGLTLPDINLRQGVLRVTGKGSKERLVPLGEEAIAWLQKYIADARPALLQGHGFSEVVFPGNRGTFMTRQTFWHRIRKHAKTGGIIGKLSPHTVRHAFATHLVNHGADLRVVQLLLGHSDLSTTQIYTHVARQRMTELHQAHHPRG